MWHELILEILSKGKYEEHNVVNDQGNEQAKEFSMKPIVCLCTCPDKEVAEKLACMLIEENLAACVNLLPGIESVYRWDGNIERSQEVLLLIKSSRELFPSLEAFIKEKHPYDVPELIALKAKEVSEHYLAWMKAELAELEPTAVR